MSPASGVAPRLPTGYRAVVVTADLWCVVGRRVVRGHSSRKAGTQTPVMLPSPFTAVLLLCRSWHECLLDSRHQPVPR